MRPPFSYAIPEVSSSQDPARLVALAAPILSRTPNPTPSDPLTSAQFLQATLDALTSQVAVLAADGTILVTNAAWRRFTEHNRGAAQTCGIGANYLTVCDKALGADADEASEAAQGIRDVLAGRRADFHLEYPCHSRREERWFVLRATPLEVEGVSYIVVAHENITELKLAERTLRDSEESYRRLVETALEGVWALDSEFHTTYVNEQMALMLGYSAEEMVGRSPLEFAYPVDRSWMQSKLRGCQYGFHARFDGRYRRRDGSEIWLQANTRPLWEEGNFVGVLGMFTDITDHKQSEAHQRTLLQGLHAVVEIADELLTAQDLDTLTRRSVELGRRKLGLERCSLYLLRPGDEMARGTYGTDLSSRTTDERSQYFDRTQHWHEALDGVDFSLPGAQRWFLDPAHPLVSSDPARGEGELHPVGRVSWVVATPIPSAEGIQGVLFNDTAISGAPIDATRQEIVVVYCSLLGNILARRRAEEALRNATTALERMAKRSQPDQR